MECKDNCGNCSVCGFKDNRIGKGNIPIVTPKKPCDCDPPQGFSYLPGNNPTQWLWNPDDIALFDTGTGLGSGVFQNWGIMDGRKYKTPNGIVQPPNMQDRLPLGGGSSAHPIGSQGGSFFIPLSVDQLPAHTHTYTPVAHTHVVNDAGHTHGIVDPGHTHAASQSGHSHAYTGSTTGGGGHNHNWKSVLDGRGDGTNQTFVNDHSNTGETPVTLDGTGVTGVVQGEGTHEHNYAGSTDTQDPNVTVQSANTGVSVQSAITGVTTQASVSAATIGSVGSGAAIDVTNPYFSGLWVTKLYS